jgi:hypothetical protein
MYQRCAPELRCVSEWRAAASESERQCLCGDCGTFRVRFVRTMRRQRATRLAVQHARTARSVVVLACAVTVQRARTRLHCACAVARPLCSARTRLGPSMAAARRPSLLPGSVCLMIASSLPAPLEC